MYTFHLVDQMEHVEIDFDGGQIVTNEDVNRVQILFDEKPDEKTRPKLKTYGFRWSPKESAWQAPHTPVYLSRAKSILGIPETKPAAISDEDTAAQTTPAEETAVDKTTAESIAAAETAADNETELFQYSLPV